MNGRAQEELTLGDVQAAEKRIRDIIPVTSLKKSILLSEVLGINVFFKCDFNLPTGSFKERGGRNALKVLMEARTKGVVAASAGNHALALAYHGANLGIPVTVVMPVTAPIMKVERCRHYKAEVIIFGQTIAESKDYAHQLGVERGLDYINGYNDPAILAGTGTIGLEMVKQMKEMGVAMDAVVVPMGGGGLIAGISLAVKSLSPTTLVIGAESEACPCFTESLKAKRPVRVAVQSTIADGLAVPEPGHFAFATAQKFVDQATLVSEDDIAVAILRLLELEKAVVEGAGATGLAACLTGALNRQLQGKNVVIPLCGGNIDTTALGRCIERGLAADGRLVRFKVTIDDRPGGIMQLTGVVADSGASVKDIFHERAWVKKDIFSVEVKIVAETKNRQHAGELHAALVAKYGEGQVRWDC